MGIRRNHRKIRKNFELNENENTTYPNLWNVANTVLSKKFLILEQDETFKIYNLSFHFKKLGKEE